MSAEVLGGDFPKGSKVDKGWSGIKVSFPLFSGSEEITDNIEKVELITEENQKKFLGAAGLGLAGGLLLGPVGAIAGLLAGGRSKEVCFACYLKDGRKFLAKGDTKTYQAVLAKTF